jgi:hypothetical protein
MAGLLILALLIGLGLLSAFGLTTDSRDPEYGVGPLFHPKTHDARRHAKATVTN